MQVTARTADNGPNPGAVGTYVSVERIVVQDGWFFILDENDDPLYQLELRSFKRIEVAG